MLEEMAYEEYLVGKVLEDIGINRIMRSRINKDKVV